MKEDINKKITSLIWNHGLNLKRGDTDKHGYDKLINYICEIENKKEKLRSMLVELKDCDYISRAVEKSIDKVLEETI